MSDSEPMTTYQPGAWVGLAARDTWVLVDLPADHVIVRTCWSLISTGATVDAVLDLLAGAGIAGAPSFALARITSQERRVVVRGAVRFVVQTVEGDELTIEAHHLASWRDEPIDAEVKTFEVSVAGADASQVRLPMSHGVTMASALRIDPDARASVAATPAPASPSAAEPRVPQADVPQAEEPSGPAPADPPSYDHLFGATQNPAMPAPVDPSVTAGWHTMTPPDDVLDSPADEPVPPPVVAGPAPVAAPALYVAPDAPAGLIDAVPRFGATPQTPSPPPTRPPDAPSTGVPPESRPADVSMTVDRARLRDDLAAGPTVLAGHCPNRHLSPAHAAICRVCGAPMPGGDGFEIPRPALGVLRLSTGDVVTLDRGVLLGRAPHTDLVGDDRPHVVRLKSPENDISRNHAEIVLDGWNVYIRDLDSVNGTEVTLPGQRPTRLRANDLQLIENGARVTLADEVTLVFEVTS